jgi:hypothetical protein
MTDNCGSISGHGKKSVCTSKPPDRIWIPPSILLDDYRELVLRQKAAGAWLFQLLSNCAKVKNTWSHTFTTLNDFMA